MWIMKSIRPQGFGLSVSMKQHGRSDDGLVCREARYFVSLKLLEHGDHGVSGLWLVLAGVVANLYNKDEMAVLVVIIVNPGMKIRG